VDDAASPAWDAEARQMAYLGTPPGGGSEVFLFDADTRDTRQLTALEGSIRGIQQFDGERQRLLVLYSETLQADPQAPVCVDYLPLKQDGIGPAGLEATRLGTVDLASGEYTACVDSGGDVLEAQWAPGGRQLAWVQRPGGRQRHGSELCCAT